MSKKMSSYKMRVIENNELRVKNKEFRVKNKELMLKIQELMRAVEILNLHINDMKKEEIDVDKKSN